MMEYVMKNALETLILMIMRKFVIKINVLLILNILKLMKMELNIVK